MTFYAVETDEITVLGELIKTKELEKFSSKKARDSYVTKTQNEYGEHEELSEELAIQYSRAMNQLYMMDNEDRSEIITKCENITNRKNMLYAESITLAEIKSDSYLRNFL